MKSGKIIGVGVGPGDPDLLTIKAIHILHEADVVCAPTTNSAGNSLALDIIRPTLQNRKSTPEVITLIFPMVRDETELERAWARNTDQIAKHAQEGKLVAFVAVGDTSLYSSFTYVARALKIKYPEIPVEIIPGVTSLSACMARARIPLAFGEEALLIMPRLDLNLLKEQSRLVDNIVWMKGVKNVPETANILKQSARFSDESQVIIAKRCTLPGEELWKGEIRDASLLKLPEDYFAMMVVRRKSSDA